MSLSKPHKGPWFLSSLQLATMNITSIVVALSLGFTVLAGPFHRELTNAQRLKLGLGPKAPRTLFDPTGMFIAT